MKTKENEHTPYISYIASMLKNAYMFILCVLCFMSMGAYANDAATNTLSFTSGTGFYVSSQHIITNEHVVRGCEYIKVRGAVKPAFAKLLDADAENDLALLRTTGRPSQIAALRGTSHVKKGEDITILGYPLDHGISGKYLIRQAKITDTEDPFGKSTHFLFTDSVAQGNSGGPIVDTNGTVVGVVVGKMSYYLEDASLGAKASNEPVKTSSVAISIGTLKRFLNANNIFYRIDNLRYGYTDEYIERKARRYIVNVHCIQGAQ